MKQIGICDYPLFVIVRASLNARLSVKTGSVLMVICLLSSYIKKQQNKAKNNNKTTKKLNNYTSLFNLSLTRQSMFTILAGKVFYSCDVRGTKELL